MYSLIAAPTTSPIVSVTILDKGWLEPSVVISILSAVFTLIALLFAYRSNATAKNSLTSALRIQEQSKNTELLDKRVQLYKDVNSSEKTSNQLLELVFEVQVLFNDPVLNLLQAYIAAVLANEKAHQNMSDYLSERKRREAYFSDDELPEVIADMECYSHSEDRDLYQKYIESCKSTELLFDPSCGEHEEAMVCLNYNDISIQLSSTNKAVTTTKRQLLEAISSYIKNSIKHIES